ncbi:MAG: hypothetical protein Tsb0016_17560 [Sphingomonadales bacterium]
MTEALIASYKPYLVTLAKKGRTYYWCACGRSAKQPFCDGAHKGTGIEPVTYVARQDQEEVLLCGCKQTRSAPVCDGSHNALADTYAQATASERQATAHLPVTPRDGGNFGKAIVDGGAYVLTPPSSPGQAVDGWDMLPLITAADGAKMLSLYRLAVGTAEAAKLGFGDGEAVLFVASGNGVVTIAGKPFAVAPETALHVRRGEAVTAAASDGRLVILATVCPASAVPAPKEHGAPFDTAYPNRAQAVDPSLRQAMADRFYQVLAGRETGSEEITAFIGEIPRSRAAAHHHLYEETIFILSGAGYLWTEHARAAVQPGDVIFLPRKQMHSLECTDAGGMRLAGSFYPSGSPAINY